MKRVVLTVPDTITHVGGRSDYSSSDEEPVDERTIVLALITNEYHINWYFADPKSIKIESIEDVED